MVDAVAGLTLPQTAELRFDPGDPGNGAGLCQFPG